MTDCTGCGQPVGQNHIETQLAGRVTGTWHKKCYRRRRYEMSGSSQHEPRTGGTYFTRLGKR